MSEGRDERDEAEPFVMPIEDFIDLHPFRPQEIRAVVDSYLDAAAEAGFREVRLIHGRGKGVQRDSIRRLLKEDPRILGFKDAPAERGGWGATVVTLID